MSIQITKLENNLSTEDYIYSPLYGKIKIVKKLDTNAFTYFDNHDGYDLFVDETGNNTAAVKIETMETSNFIEKDINNITNKYDVETIKYDDTTPAIIIKADNNIILKIENEYKNNKNYDVSLVTPEVLFLEPTNIDIQLEDDNNLLNSLDDNVLKDIVKKTGASLSGSETKDELKGIIKGALTSKK